jgi:dynein light chain roadblock-type
MGGPGTLRAGQVKSSSFHFRWMQAGTILRQSKSLSSSDAAIFATEMSKLTAKARHVVRDLNPKNDLEIFRVRCKEREILTAPGPDDSYLVIVIQKWTPTVPEAPLPPTAAPAPA